MKKLGITLIVLLSFCLVGCGSKTKESKAIEEFSSSVTNATSYELVGDMTVKKDTTTISFSMDVCYKAPAYYKVTYVNNSNNERQVLLKNDDGVYVLSPELNKEFKFESKWPLNSSHIYILNKVVNDICDDTASTVKTEGDFYVITSKISHKIRNDLVSQSVYLNTKDYSLDHITYDTATDTIMTFTVTSLEFGKTFESNTFNVDAIMESESSLIGEGGSNKASEIIFGDVFDDVVLTSSSTSSDYTILKYSGQKNYTIIYQSYEAQTVSTAERIYDDFVEMDKCLGFVSKNSLTFYLTGKEFKILSAELTVSEMIDVANSLVIS